MSENALADVAQQSRDDSSGDSSGIVIIDRILNNKTPSKGEANSQFKAIMFVCGLVLFCGAIIVVRGAWKKHVTPLYSRASNPRRKKRKARRSIR